MAEIGGFTQYRTTKYLKFYEGLSDSGKTKRVLIYTVNGSQFLGEIKWMGRWRQYALHSGHAIWNKGCMTEVAEEIDRLMAERRKT